MSILIPPVFHLARISQPYKSAVGGVIKLKPDRDTSSPRRNKSPDDDGKRHLPTPETDERDQSSETVQEASGKNRIDVWAG